MDAPDTLRPKSDDSMVTALERYADNPSAFLALNSGNSAFTHPGITGFVCYRVQGKRWLQFGGPFSAAADRESLQTRFLDHARSRGVRVVGVQLQRADAELLAGLGLTVNQVGASYAVGLTDFSLRGKRFVRLRNKVSRALRAGLEVREVDADRVADGIDRIDARWLREKGRHVKELKFLIGEVGGPWQARRRLFVGTLDGTPVAYISFAPAWGARPGWLHDLSRRLPECPPGVMEAINVHAIERFRAAGAPWLHFGFTPFTGLDARHRLATASRATDRIVRFLAEHGERVYPSRSQVEYKMKWHPTAVFPEYFAFDGGVSARSLWSLARATNIL